MAVEWNKVTWYSKIVAVILFVAVFYVGFHLGQQKNDITKDEGVSQKESPSSPATPPVSLASREIKEENFTGKVAVVTGTSPLVKLTQKYIDQTVADFKKQADADVPDIRAKFGADWPPAHYEIDIDAKYLNSKKTESVAVTGYTYTGGAHGSSLYNVFTASVPGGKILSLSDVVKGDQRTAFTEFIKKQLTAWRQDGAQVVFPEDVKGLTFDSFKNWSLDDKNLYLYFDQYAIGPGALGAVAFPVPLGKIQNYLNSAY